MRFGITVAAAILSLSANAGFAQTNIAQSAADDAALAVLDMVAKNADAPNGGSGKAIDMTYAGGLGYTKTTGLGVTAMATGSYRVRRDPNVRPSYTSIFANVSLTGSYSAGADGRTNFRDRSKLDYLLIFSSLPSYYWGSGYINCDRNASSSYVRRRAMLYARYLYPLTGRLYVGGTAEYNFTRATDYSQKFTQTEYLPEGERMSYSATGIGVNLEYDSRNSTTDASRGIYASACEMIYPKGLGTCRGTLWSTTFTVDWYQRLWSSAVLAADLYGELHSDGTPWVMQSRAGGSYRMRGYYEGRYTDRNLIVLQVELRQRIWRTLSGVVWGGAGNIFGINSFDWRHTLPTYGLGVRWQLKYNIRVRVDYGFGRRTSGLVLSINEAF